MTESKKEVQIAFRVDQALRRRFYAAIKGQGLDTADVMRPVVERIADAGPEPQDFTDKPRENPTSQGLKPNVPVGHQLTHNIDKGIVEAAQDLAKLLKNGAKIATQLEQSLAKTAVTGQDRAVSEVPEKLRTGRESLGDGPRNAPARKKKAG